MKKGFFITLEGGDGCGKSTQCKMLLDFLKQKGIDPNDVIMVGDQMITDVCCGNGAKIKVILTDKLVKEDQFTTHFNRFFERPFRNWCMKHGKLIDWRIRYGKS